MHKLPLALILASAAPATAVVLTHSALQPREVSPSSLSSSSSSSRSGEIQVSGEAVIAVVPDRATMQFQVQASGKTQLEAQAKIDEATAALLKQLVDAGAKSTELTSGATHLQPVYARDRHGQPLYLQVESYTAVRTVSACAHDLAQVAPWQRAARSAGGISVGEVALEVSRLAELKEQARLQAAASARKKGRELVEVLGGRLGAPLQISENASSTTDPGTYKRANAIEDRVVESVVSGDFAAGTMSVVATVSVTFEVLAAAPG